MLNYHSELSSEFKTVFIYLIKETFWQIEKTETDKKKGNRKIIDQGLKDPMCWSEPQ